MPTVTEQLRSAGWTEDDIKNFDAQKLKGIETIFTSAEQERQKGELAQRAAADMFENQITPALNDWGAREANLSAERDYYKTLADKAKDGGFIPAAPPFQAAGATPPRGDGGRFVANSNPVPGSPDFREFENKVAGAIGSLSDLQWRYRSLFGREMPDAPTALSAEAAAQHMSMPEWAARKYDFAGKEAAQRAEEQKKHDDAIREEARVEVEKRYAEAGGTNPNLRIAQTSRFSDLKKGVKDGTQMDPLKMNREQRHAATAASIRQDIAATVN